jgi:hypothetical protein
MRIVRIACALLRHGTFSGEQIFAEVMDETDSGLITAAEFNCWSAVRAVADETMEDALARTIAVRAGRRPDCERLLFAIVDGLEDYKLTAPAFILRQAQRVLCAPAVARRSLAPAAPAKVGRDLGDGIGDFTADLPLYVEL